MADAKNGTGKWGDLATRVASAAALVAIVVAALWAGPLAWWLLVLLVNGVMLWELAPLCARGVSEIRQIMLGIMPMISTLLIVATQSFETLSLPLTIVAALLPILAGVVLLPSGRVIWAGYTLMMTAGATFLIIIHQNLGGFGVGVLIALIAISDTLGYFVGRMLGGPKFWPKVSPKKTWSGTVAGWIGAALFGALVIAPTVTPDDGVSAEVIVITLMAALLAFAGQMGDIAESAIKRRAGVKDASNLIPGHGGFLDRLDALIAASAMGFVILIIGSMIQASQML